MKKSAKRYLIGMIVSICLIFAWIPLAIFLTGGKETEDFTKSDAILFAGFLVVEILTCIAAFYFANRFGKLKNPQADAAPKELPVGQPKWLGFVLLLGAYGLALASMIAGIVAGAHIPVSAHPYLQWLLWFFCIAPFFMLLLNLLLHKRTVRKFQKQKVAQFQQYLFSHRDFAEKTSAEKLRFLKHWRRFTDLYAASFTFAGLIVSFCSGILYETDIATPLCLLSAFFLLCTASRIRFACTRPKFEKGETYLEPEAYPKLYAIAEKAANALSCRGKIHISTTANCNAGIAKIGNAYSIYIGVILLSVISEEELYAILLHEFSHVANDRISVEKEGAYDIWLSNGGTRHFLTPLTDLMFRYFDSTYHLQYQLYQYASSLLTEESADQAMVQYGNRQAAASALLKLGYYDMFTWEKGTYDTDCIYASEKPSENFVTSERDAFQKSISLRADDWNQILSREILSKNASHPTLNMRLAALGTTDYQILQDSSSESFQKERGEALRCMDALICKEQAKTYDEDRKRFYLEPKSTVEAWQSSGEPLVAEAYADVVSALRDLGMVSKANALCDRAIASLSDAASCYAYYMKGCNLLHQYDPAGLAYVYHAIENNQNYIEEGLEMIGTFCCMTGNQKELDIYREKAVYFLQKEIDEYNEIGVLNKNDRLSAEQLPGEMLSEILAYITSIDGGAIQTIYLVRKTITETFFTSAFVIRFKEQATDEQQDDVMHKIFCYLDTCSDWQFSLFHYTNVVNVKVENIPGSVVYQA